MYRTLVRYNEAVGDVRDPEAEAAALEAEMAQVCGTINMATGRLVSLIAKVLATGAWEGWGIRSPEQWVSWKCGVSSARARKLVTMARRLPELPATRGALEAGELAEDQVGVVCRHAPPWADAEVAELARHATVSQLSHTLRRYSWEAEPVAEEASTEADEEPRRASFFFTDEGGWRLFAHLPPDEGALVERALDTERRRLIDDGVMAEPSWADALVAMAEHSLSEQAARRPAGDRHVMLVHLRADDHGPSAQVHLGPRLPDALRRLLGCDGRMRPVVEVAGVP